MDNIVVPCFFLTHSVDVLQNYIAEKKSKLNNYKRYKIKIQLQCILNRFST